MRKFATALLLVFLFVAGAMAASSLYAQGNTNEGSGMMGNMSGMMKMMSDMMDHCNGMVSDSRPNDQWRKSAPSEPERNG